MPGGNRPRNHRRDRDDRRRKRRVVRGARILVQRLFQCVELGGGGLPQFEVWDRGRFEEYERTRADRLPTLFERLSGLGV